MNEKCVHKDKERLRHRKHIQLLDDVLKIVPKAPDGSETRVRKLRRLVLYYHFMQMACAQITGKCPKSSRRPKKKVKKRAAKSVCEPPKVQPEMKKKRRKANIVFLEVDRSVDPKSILINNNNDNYEESTLAAKSEYRVPELLPGVAHSAVQEIDFSSRNSNLFEIRNSVSAPECEVLPTTFTNNYGDLYLSSEPAKQSEYCLHNGNETCFPVVVECPVTSDDGETENSLYDMENFPRTVVVNDTNLGSSRLRGTSINSVSQNFSNYSFLKNIHEGTCRNFQNSNSSMSGENVECISNCSQTYPCVEDSDSPISVSSRECQNSILSGNDLYYKPNYYISSEYAKPPFYNWASTVENVSDCSSSTDNLQIDVENVSSCTNSPLSNLYEYSESFSERNNVDRSIYPACNNTQLCEFLGTSCYEGVKQEHFAPELSSDNYVENQNETSYGSENMLKSHNKHICSNNLKNDTIVFPSELAQSYNGRVIPTGYVDEDSFYCNLIGTNNQLDKLLLKQPALGIVSANCFPESIPEYNMPALFEEESSYSLSQYIDNR